MDDEQTSGDFSSRRPGADAETVLAYRVAAVEKRLGELDQHGTRGLPLLKQTVARLDKEFVELIAAVRDVALLRAEVGRNTEAFKAMRNALYSLAVAVLSAAIIVVLLG